MQEWGEEVSKCFRPYLAEAGEAELVLRQISDNRFELVSGSTYESGGLPPIHLPPSRLSSTDLASVPPALKWVVGSYGRHTFAALLHDALQKGVVETDRVFPTDEWDAAVEIDAVFLSALKCLGVPSLLSHLMWAGVRISSRWSSNGPRKLLTFLWAVGALAGTTIIGWGVLNSRWDAVALALAMPLVGALLWGKDMKAGVFAGYGVVFVAIPTALGWLSSLVFKSAQAVFGGWVK